VRYPAIARAGALLSLLLWVALMVSYAAHDGPSFSPEGFWQLAGLSLALVGAATASCAAHLIQPVRLGHGLFLVACLVCSVLGYVVLTTLVAAVAMPGIPAIGHHPGLLTVWSVLGMLPAAVLLLIPLRR